jgi:hypothetical protein
MADNFGAFLSGLLDAITTGARGTADAFQQDADAVSQGQLPPQAMKAGGQVINAMGNPSINPVIPALTYTRQVYDPVKDAYDVVSKTYPGGDWTQMFTREGGLGPFLQKLLKSMELPRP